MSGKWLAERRQAGNVGDMKTTIELPVSLFRQTQALAERENKTLLQIVIEGVQSLVRERGRDDMAIADKSPPEHGFIRYLSAEEIKRRNAELTADERSFMRIDKTGLPVLKARPGPMVTQAIVDAIRDEEGI
jgi:hypothetical protein